MPFCSSCRMMKFNGRYFEGTKEGRQVSKWICTHCDKTPIKDYCMECGIDKRIVELVADYSEKEIEEVVKLLTILRAARSQLICKLG